MKLCIEKIVCRRPVLERIGILVIFYFSSLFFRIDNITIKSPELSRTNATLRTRFRLNCRFLPRFFRNWQNVLYVFNGLAGVSRNAAGTGRVVFYMGSGNWALRLINRFRFYPTFPLDNNPTIVYILFKGGVI
jgi:hypothetical protein